MKDMGLGKTLTTLALIMGSIDASSQLSQPSSEGVEFRPTLIVTPLSRRYRGQLGKLWISLIACSPRGVGPADPKVVLAVVKPHRLLILQQAYLSAKDQVANLPRHPKATESFGIDDL